MGGRREGCEEVYDVVENASDLLWGVAKHVGTTEHDGDFERLEGCEVGDTV